MRFELLRQRVERAEMRVESCMDRAQTQRHVFRDAWRRGWTPGRIVVAGLAAGFVAGRVQPLQLAGKGREWLKLLQLAAPLLAGVAARAVDDAPRAPTDAGADADS